MTKLFCKDFNSLSTHQLFDILHLRTEVFVVEQTCAYQDPDELDPRSLHMWIEDETGIVAYARLLAPGLRFEEAAIGRVLTSMRNRRKGYGKTIMSEAIKMCAQHFGVGPIRISAQCYLREFYEDLGFRCVSAEYDEDGIPHQEMLRDV